MSDFDKEAERERLREKYERDKQKREATEQMSELLLQGATMTNAHCSECNDPIFRYDGQEFCATCEKPVDRDTGDESGDEEATEGTQNAGVEVTSPSDDARVSFGGETVDPSGRDESGSQRPVETERDGTGGRQNAGGDAEDGVASRGNHRRQQSRSSAQSQPNRQQPRDGQQRGQAAGTSPGEQPVGTPSGEQSAGVALTGSDVTTVRDSLVRTMTRFSEQAEACEDPQRAREYLAAAREAAETLEALRR